MPGVRLVQLLAPVKFENRDELLQTRNRQFLMLDRVAKNEAVFEGLQSACGSVSAVAQERGIADDRLEGEILVELEVIKKLGHNLGVMADLGMGRNAHLNPGA